MEVDPGELEVGDLADDWEFVSRLLQEGRNQPVAYQLTELARCWRTLGEVLARDSASRGVRLWARRPHREVAVVGVSLNLW